MMFKFCKKNIYMMIILSALLIINININYVYSQNTMDNRTLIVYENENDFGFLENKINHVKQLLYVFNKEVESINIKDYKSMNMYEFDNIIVINIDNNIENIAFLEDLSYFSNNIYWVGNRLEDYLDYAKKYNISYEEKSLDITELNYKGKKFYTKEGCVFNIVNVLENVEVLSTMSDGYNTYPYLVRNNNLYYISEYLIDENYIFEDSLNDFYGVSEIQDSEIFVSIEDVDIFRDTEELRAIADYLHSKGVPFIVALIPTYTDSRTGNINTLESNQEFIDTIKYMQDKGGSIILQDNVDRVLSGLRLCIENGIYPIGFEAPHYAMDSDEYKKIKKYFSTYVGLYQNNDNDFATSTFPYTIKDSNLFNTFIPGNMGYIDEDDILSIDKIKNNYRKLSIVRGYTGGFFYHPYIGIDNLIEVVEFLIDNDVKFLDLKEKDNYVRYDDIEIISKNGEISCSYDESKPVAKDIKNNSQYRFFRNINNVVIVFVIIVLVLFLLVFIRFKMINKDKFRGR